MNALVRPLLLLAAILGTGTAAAEKRSPPADQAETVRRAERQAGGQVIRAESQQRDGRDVYVIRVLTDDGHVREVRSEPRRQQDNNDRRRDEQDRRPQRRQDGEPQNEDSDPS